MQGSHLWTLAPRCLWPRSEHFLLPLNHPRRRSRFGPQQGGNAPFYCCLFRPGSSSKPNGHTAKSLKTTKLSSLLFSCMWTPDPLGLPGTPKKGARSPEQRLFKTTRSLSGGHSPGKHPEGTGVAGQWSGTDGRPKEKMRRHRTCPKDFVEEKKWWRKGWLCCGQGPSLGDRKFFR